MLSLAFGNMALLATIVLATSAAEAGQQAVTFPSLSADSANATMLTGELYLPAEPGPHAAVVLLSGCYGVEDLHRQWAAEFVDAGLAALVVDSLTPRGVKEVCTDPFKVGPLPRAEDAYGAKRFLAGRADIAADRIALAGWSHGGWTLLRAFHPPFYSVRELIAEAGAFQAAIAVYPYCDIAGPFEIPLLVLIGDADDWCPKRLCDNALGRPDDNPRLEYQVYAGATHSFDDPFGGNEAAIRDWLATEPPDAVTLEAGGGYRYLGHLIRYDAAAHADAKARVRQFLRTYLQASE